MSVEEFRSGLAIMLICNFLVACDVMSGHESTGEYLSDANITAQIKADVVNDSILNSYEIGIETYQGVVQLSGFVDTQRQKNEVGRLARHVKGVESVHNNIIVRNKFGKRLY